MTRVSPIIYSAFLLGDDEREPPQLTTLPPTEPKKVWSFNEWIVNFLQDDGLYSTDDPTYEDDIYEDTLESGERGFEEDGPSEVLIIFGIVAALVALLYYRQYRQQQQRQREQGQQQPQPRGQGQQHQGGGQLQGAVFAPPGEPDFAGWGGL